MSEPKRTPLEHFASALALAACAALAAGCATASTHTSVTTATHLPSPPASPAKHAKPPAPTPKQRAEADAAAILASFAVPPGASKLSGAPSAGQGALKKPPQQPADPDLVDDVTWWEAPGQPQQVLAWEQAHLSHRFAADESGSEQDGQVTVWFDGFTLPPVSGVLDSRTLLVEAAAAGGGKTALRVDAQVTWIPARPAAEVVPSATRAVTLSLLPNLNLHAKPPAPVTITNRDQVGKLAALIDSLPEFPPGTYSCPADFGDALVLTFRARPGGPALAVATIELSGCEAVDFTVGGKQQPALSGPDGGRPVAAQALKIAGLKWTLPNP